MKLESVHVTVDKLDIAIKEIENVLHKVAGMDIESAAVFYEEFRTKYDYLLDVAGKWTTVKERLSAKILPEIVEASQLGQSVTLKNGKRVTVQYKVMCSMPDKDAGKQWLIDNGLGDLVQDTVNAGTLTAVAKARLEENEPLPEELFKMSTKASTSITAPRAKRK